MSARTIIIGDIHGCLDEWKGLLEKVAFEQNKDRLILVGDLINKGPYPYETLLFARKLNCEVVMGNHERAYLLWLQGKKKAYQGFQSLKNKMLPNLDQWIDWFEHLPFYIDDPAFIVVHAGINPNIPLDKTDPHLLTTIRNWNGVSHTTSTESDPAWFDTYKKDKLIVFGHWAKLGLLVKKNVIGLDSGCVYGNKLSAVILPERKIVHYPAKKVYQRIDFKYPDKR